MFRFHVLPIFVSCVLLGISLSSEAIPFPVSDFLENPQESTYDYVKDYQDLYNSYERNDSANDENLNYDTLEQDRRQDVHYSHYRRGDCGNTW